jgi:hypothetical protein
MKYGVIFGDKILTEFKKYVDMIESDKLSYDLLINIKSIAYYKASKTLKDRGYPCDRVEAFVNFIDIDPEFAYSLLSSKGRLKKSEIAIITKKS